MNEAARSGEKRGAAKFMARGSVRRKLLLTLLLGFVAVWLLGGGISVWQMQDQVHRLLDTNLRQRAAPLLHEVEEGQPDHVFSVFRYSPQLAFQIWRDGTHLELRSKLAPEQPLTGWPPGFSDNVIDGRAWRVFSVWDAGHRYLVMVGQPKAERGLITHEIVARLMQSLVLMLPLFALMIWIVIGVVLRPLNVISEQIARRDANNLRPLEGEVPREIESLARRLNHLLASLDASLESERRFTADAAHELRTPLAALKSQIQVAQGARATEQRERALANALQACDLATHRVEQMLTLARLEHDIWRESPAAFDVGEVAAFAIAEVASHAAGKRVTLVLEAAEAVKLTAHAGLWSILLRNLLDNAVRYTQPNTTVTVRVVQYDDGVEIVVEDEGPGIPTEQIDKVFTRFERLERREEMGVGLGLSIVARIVELHRAQIDLLPGENGRGLRVRIRVAKAPA